VQTFRFRAAVPGARLVPRAMLAAALLAALALAGCGRKGPLDPPPMAANGDVQSQPEGVAAAPPSDGRPAQPQSPPVEKKKIPILDWLIN
jgi:predicted small lipoprotein YifL